MHESSQQTKKDMMQSEHEKLQINGLTSVEIGEIERKTKVTYPSDQRTDTPGAHHDPGSLAVIVAATSSVSTLLGVILAKTNSGRRRRFKFTRISKDEQTSVEFDEKIYSSETPKADVIKAIAQGLNVDASELFKAIDGDN
jgi:hypothetical protein